MSYSEQKELQTNLFFCIFFCYIKNMATKNYSIELDEQTAESAETILNQLGLTVNQAANIFFSKVVLTKGIPFAVNLDGAVTESTPETEGNSSEQKEEKPVQKTKKARRTTKKTQKKKVLPEMAQNLDLTPSKDKGTPDLETGVLIKTQPVTIAEETITVETTIKEEPVKTRKSKAAPKKRGRKSKKTETVEVPEETPADEQIPFTADDILVDSASEDILAQSTEEEIIQEESVIEESISISEPILDEPEFNQDAELAKEISAISQDIIIPVPEEEIPAEEEKPAKPKKARKASKKSSKKDDEEEDADTDDTIPDDLFEKWEFGDIS